MNIGAWVIFMSYDRTIQSGLCRDFIAKANKRVFWGLSTLPNQIDVKIIFRIDNLALKVSCVEKFQHSKSRFV